MLDLILFSVSILLALDGFNQIRHERDTHGWKTPNMWVLMTATSLYVFSGILFFLLLLSQ